MTERQVREVLRTAFDVIMARLESGERVSIANFGAWRPTERGPRTNRNIHTGEMIQVAARRAVNWSPGTEFKNRRKGIRLKNAWAVARVYAAATDIDKAVAFTALFVDAPVDQLLA